MSRRDPRQTRSASTSARRPSAGRAGSAAQRPRRPGAPAPKVERAPRNTNRAFVLLIVIAVLVFSFASSARAYLNQQNQIRQLQEQIAKSKAAIAAGVSQKDRLKDPAYVEQLARLRFGWVLPGQTPYIVLNSDGQPLDSKAAFDAHQPNVSPAPVAWWSRLGGSLQDADNPPQPAKRTTPQTKPSTKVD